MNFLTWLSKLDTRQWGAASRQYITFGAGILATLAVITTTQSQDLVKNLGDFVSGAAQVGTGLAALATVIIAIKNSFTAAHNSGPEVAVQRVEELAKSPDAPKSVTVEAKAALITATANLDEVKAVALEPTAPEAPALNVATPENVKLAA